VDGETVAGVSRIALIGFSGTGKSTVAQLLAERLGWRAVDVDAEIERECGATTPAIFREQGEAAFRATERKMLLRLCGQDEVVIATGGGAVVEEPAWSAEGLGRAGTLVVALDARPETMLERLRQQAEAEGDAVERPMLAGDDPLGRIRDLKGRRQAAYDRAGLTLPVDGVNPSQVADELAAVVRCLEGEPLRLQLDAASASSEIAVGPGVLGRLGARGIA